MRSWRITPWAILALASTGCATNDVPVRAMEALRNAHRYELLSLDPIPLTKPTPPDDFHGWRVLGRVAVEDAATRRKLNDALRAGARENPSMAAACFEPRHGVRAVRGDRATDLVICFECFQVQVFEGTESTKGFLVSPSPQRTFDAVLTELGAPLAEPSS